MELIHRAGTHDAWGVIYPDSNRPYGLASVSIDGQPARAINGAVGIDADGRAVIDTSRDGRTPLVRGLTPGRHRLTLTNLGQPREPGGNTLVTVIGFQVDTEIPGNEAQQTAWRIADAVRGGEAWRQRAAELASTVQADSDLRSLEELQTAARQLAAATARMRAVRAEPPPSAMVAREKECWKPHAETQGLPGAVGRFEETQRQPTGRRGRIPVRVRRGSAVPVAAGGRQETGPGGGGFLPGRNTFPAPDHLFHRRPAAFGAVPNYVWQSEPDGNRWGCSIRTWDPAHPETPAKTIFAEPDSVIFDLNLAYDGQDRVVLDAPQPCPVLADL